MLMDEEQPRTSNRSGRVTSYASWSKVLEFERHFTLQVCFCQSLCRSCQLMFLGSGVLFLPTEEGKHVCEGCCLELVRAQETSSRGSRGTSERCARRSATNLMRRLPSRSSVSLFWLTIALRCLCVIVLPQVEGRELLGLSSRFQWNNNNCSALESFCRLMWFTNSYKFVAIVSRACRWPWPWPSRLLGFVNVNKKNGFCYQSGCRSVLVKSKANEANDL
ncbi:hypothetical protein MPTK1_1g20000 [Marchantia polymorpha subsp. ruderalis]|uniref:Uncharacterized protein n=2 Tax=Marchantia polymorpha TaxID=3197 RepID=A0AAF6AS41_MARPO|nr:hypothetical protein MARPO_0001s0337 [Marchantia polymorpha]BBM99261.1 hypothetical protein Mp_1g20000 [Marchantia polymorpha subsp. ruderalis]|eukprot:PTQ50343.1 hypothetical protein MARPO_0001s0337 [Marchantia polymorpha]